jgi:uncharacterized protein involved in type VI secretion and phage assembly
MDATLNDTIETGQNTRWYGAYPALVIDIVDPEDLGRVKVTLPWAKDAEGARYEAWARLATLMGGSNRGTWFIPDVDDEVLVMFEGGIPELPFVIGGLWNGPDSPPTQMDSGGENNTKIIRSRNGVQITLDDSNGQEKLVLETPGGQSVTLQDGPGVIVVEDSNGNSIKLETSGITIDASGTTITLGPSGVNITAARLNVDAGMSTFSGLVRTPVIQADTVIGATYTPGAGNIW